MSNIGKYTVYLHVFPDGKKYVGSTGTPLKTRWNGGLGYRDQKRLFGAILNTGWENIRHYILIDGLDATSAHIIEAILIRNWKTYRPSVGYNVSIPHIEGMGDFELPELKRTRVEDKYRLPVSERYSYIMTHGGKIRPELTKPVRLVETGQIFDSAHAAAAEMLINVSRIYSAARNGRACGTCWIEDKDEGWCMEVPAHWEYINTNTEEKDGKHD